MINVECVANTHRGELIIERAMRSCHDHDVPMTAIPNKNFIQSVIKMGHTSPLEHATATFKISGVSRSLTHQLVRHRIASYTQESQRYVKMLDFPYTIPDSINDNSEAKNIYIKCMEDIQSIYKSLLDLGIKREDARYVIPNACNTKIFVTMNLREFRSFIDLRSEKHAQWEIQKLSNCILTALFDMYPIVFEDLYNKYIHDLKYRIYSTTNKDFDDYTLTYHVE